MIKFPKHALDPTADWIKSIHEDGKGNWVLWSTDRPGLDGFTKRAYPNGEGHRCPYGRVGDRLWVRETFWTSDGEEDDPDLVIYDADNVYGVVVYEGLKAVGVRLKGEEEGWFDEPYKMAFAEKHPSIFMPRWASRITLEITQVRAERLQAISLNDILAEGFEPPTHGDHANQYWREETLHAFAMGWNKINGKRKGCRWEDNPWVFVIEFRRIK